MGTGTSVGVPALGCGCKVCLSDDPFNQRTRCSVAVGLPEGNLLIDTSPDMRSQLLREKIGLVHAVLYTHEHADHIFGLDDLRLFPFYLGKNVPLYCEKQVEKRIRHSYDYAFSSIPDTHAGATPNLEFHSITTEPFELLGTRIIPIRLQHGPRFEVLGFRIGNIAYCTDTSSIPDASMKLLENLDVLILDSLRYRPHITHLHLDASVEIAQKLKPKKTYFTHIAHDFDHKTVNAELPDTIELAYDGLRIPMS